MRVRPPGETPRVLYSERCALGQAQFQRRLANTSPRSRVAIGESRRSAGPGFAGHEAWPSQCCCPPRKGLVRRAAQQEQGALRSPQYFKFFECLLPLERYSGGEPPALAPAGRGEAPPAGLPALGA
jgi:hypothetical protein